MYDIKNEHGQPIAEARIRFEVEIDVDMGNVDEVYEKLLALDSHAWVRVTDVGVIPDPMPEDASE